MSKGDAEGLIWGVGKNMEHTQVLVLRYTCGKWASRGVCWGLLAGRKFGERKSDTVEEKMHFCRICQE